MRKDDGLILHLDSDITLIGQHEYNLLIIIVSFIHYQTYQITRY